MMPHGFTLVFHVIGSDVTFGCPHTSSSSVSEKHNNSYLIYIRAFVPFARKESTVNKGHPTPNYVSFRARDEQFRTLTSVLHVFCHASLHAARHLAGVRPRHVAERSSRLPISNKSLLFECTSFPRFSYELCISIPLCSEHVPSRLNKPIYWLADTL